MSVFSDDMRNFTGKVVAKTQAVIINTVAAVQDSIVNGSPITGSPGQPVGQYGPGYHPGEVGGTLKASWGVGTAENPGFGSPRWDGPAKATIATNLVYAPDNEYGIRGADGAPYRQRSSIGGRGSVRMTRNGLQLLADNEARKLA